MTSLSDQEKILGKCIGRVLTGGNTCSGIITDFSGTMITSSAGMIDKIVGSQVTVRINSKDIQATVLKIIPNNGIVQLRLSKYKDLQPISKGSTPSLTEKLYCYGFASDNLAKIEARFTGETCKNIYYLDKDNNKVLISGLFSLSTTNSNVLPGMAGGPILNSDGKMIGIIISYVSGTKTAYYLPL